MHLVPDELCTLLNGYHSPTIEIVATVCLIEQCLHHLALDTIRVVALFERRLKSNVKRLAPLFAEPVEEESAGLRDDGERSARLLCTLLQVVVALKCYTPLSDTYIKEG